MDSLKQDAGISNCKSRKSLSLIMKSRCFGWKALLNDRNLSRVLLRVNDVEVYLLIKQERRKSGWTYVKKERRAFSLMIKV